MHRVAKRLGLVKIRNTKKKTVVKKENGKKIRMNYREDDAY